MCRHTLLSIPALAGIRKNVNFPMSEKLRGEDHLPSTFPHEHNVISHSQIIIVYICGVVPEILNAVATCTLIPSWAGSQIYLLVTFGFSDRIGSSILNYLRKAFIL